MTPGGSGDGALWHSTGVSGRHLLSVALARLAGALALPAAAHAACGGVKRAYPRHPRKADPPPLAVGDSVMLGAVDELAAEGFEVNTRGCRQMTEGVDVLAARARAHSLPATVVVALGANWTVTIDEIRHALMILGRERVLGLVTPRELGGAVTSDQANMRAAGRRWPRRVKVLDWVRYSSGHDSWFGGDGLHLGPDGARGFARLLGRAFDWPIPSLTTTWTAEPRAPAGETLSGVSALPAAL